MNYHPNEIRVQERAGVRHIAERKNDIYSDIPLVAQSFLERQPFIILGAAQENGNVWASALFGNQGFVQVMDSRMIRIQQLPRANDPLHQCIWKDNNLGTIAMDFAARQRMRTNGIIRETDSNGLTLQVHQVYSNCPKYIQARDWSIADERKDDRQSSYLSTMTEAAKRLIQAADTFFIASHHPHYGADISHRGGMPGFVQVLDDHTLVFPDYKGNSMFNTLGNLDGYPQAGLVFLDFETGSMLQLSGTVEVEWGTTAINGIIGAERMVRFHVEQSRFTLSEMPLNWTFVSYSPANPKPKLKSE
ncbi:pyridoxamine 5'-phosphate oxidase family protein [Paenibacillus sp. SI8]|uniref:pyridoxamine 5'-phosphate oxidase family protein n=1 Tax=unclassified Paenibacillus TaxID=185978 RepID=UPI0034659DBC